jgi:transcription initiation factor TFIID subunit TAF12
VFEHLEHGIEAKTAEGNRKGSEDRRRQTAAFTALKSTTKRSESQRQRRQCRGRRRAAQMRPPEANPKGGHGGVQQIGTWQFLL